MENIQKIDDVTAKVIIPQPALEVNITLEQLDSEIKGIDESIGNFTNQIANLEEKKTLLENRKTELLKKGIITETTKREAEALLKKQEYEARLKNDAILEEVIIDK